MFLCSLDAEKCFDSIWHDGLFYKLKCVLPLVHWRILYNWYKCLDVVVKWDGYIHHQSGFKVTRGTKQGSILSPILFNIFIFDLLKKLSETETGLRIGNRIYNSFAYADDISLFGATVPGLQHLIDICCEYANIWRLNFGYQKSQCMVVGNNPDCFTSQPTWHLNNVAMNTVSRLEILGVTFSNNSNFKEHVQTRSQKCKRSMYALNSIGMCYPGLNSASKAHLYKSVCLPSLTYGMDSINLSSTCIKQLESTQGCIMKQVCGLSKQSHHSNLLRALNINTVSSGITNLMKANFSRLCAVDSPTRDLCLFFITRLLSGYPSPKGSSVDRLIKNGASPTELLFKNIKTMKRNCSQSDGVVDSLRSLLMHENYVKPWSNEYILVKFLTKSF